MKLSESFEKYLAGQTKPVSPVTIKNYVADLNLFSKWFTQSFHSEPTLHTITDQVVRGYIQHLKSETDTSRGSLERRLSSLRKIATYVNDTNPRQVSVFSQDLAEKAIPDAWRLSEFTLLLRQDSKSSVTFKNYLGDIKQFITWFANNIALTAAENVPQSAVAEIDSKTMQLYRDYLQDNLGMSPLSINRKLSSLRKYLGMLDASNVLKQDTALSNIRAVADNDALDNDSEEMIVNRPVSTGETQLPLKNKPYSNFPPLRLFQKLGTLGTLAFDASVVALSAIAVEKLQYLSWIATGKQVFASSAKNVFGLTELIASITKPHSDKEHGEGAQFIQHLVGANIKKHPLMTPERIKALPFHHKAIYHARFTRPDWYRKYHSFVVVHYFHFAALIIIMGAIGFGLYRAFVENPSKQNLFAAAPTAPPRILSFQGRLTDNLDNPITTAKDLRFAIYNNSVSSGSALLWQETQKVTADQDGIFSVYLGSSVAIPASVFNDNSGLYLGVTVQSDSELAPRQQIATVAFAANSETLQGLYPLTAVGAGTSNVVLALDSSGNLTIGGAATPRFEATGGAFTLSGSVLNLQTTSGSNTNVNIKPDGLGKIDLQKPLQNSTNNNNVGTAVGSVEVDDLFSILATSSGQSALTINQNGAGPLISASASGVDKFSVSNAGNGAFAGDLAIGGGDITTGGDLTINATGGQLFLADTNTIAIGGHAGGAYNAISNAGGTPTNPNVTTDNDLYVQGDLDIGGTIYVAGSPLSPGALVNYWQRTLGAVSPANITDDLLIGGSSTSSASFQVFGVGTNVGTASSAGSLTFRGTADPKINILNGENFGIRTSGGGDAGLAEKLTVLSNGNVGIGSTAPTNLFTVGATSQFQVNSTGAIAAATGITSSNTITFSSLTAARGVFTTTGGQLTTTAASQALIDSLSDETGTGLAVFGTAPTFTTSINGGATFTAFASPTTLTLGTAAGTFNIGPSGATAATIAIAGGSAATGCTIDGASGNLTCSGTITGSGGAITNLWQRTLGSLAPTNITDDVLTGSIATASAIVKLPGLVNKDALFNLGTGNVGIGSTTPTQKLDVVGAIQAQRFLDSANNAYLLDPADTSISLTTAGNVGIGTTSPVGLLHVEGRITGRALVTFNETGNQDIFAASASGTPRFVIKNNGNVGIGNMVPRAALDVVGNASLSGDLYFSGTSNTIATLNGGDLKFNVSPGGGAGSEALRLSNASGNIGIGTTSTAAFKLRIAGSIGPDVDDTYDLGSSAKRWRDLYLGPASLHIGTDLNEGTIGYNIVDNYIQFDADGNGTPEAVITDAGNIGVGTTNPSTFKVEVAGSIGPTANNTFDLGSASKQFNNTYTQNLYVGGSLLTPGALINYWQRNLGAVSPANITDDVLIGGSATASAKIRLGGTTNADSFFNTGGNVGIGTNSPAANLNVYANGSSDGIVRITDPGTTYNPQIQLFRATGSAVGTKLWLDNASGDTYLDNMYDNASGNIYVRTRTNGTPIDALSILGSGNIGIGTTNPSLGKLQINGTSGTSLLYLNPGTGAITDTAYININTRARFGYDGSTNFVVIDDGGSSKPISLVSGGAERIHITTAGNVGIGTASPLATLQVNGGTLVGTSTGRQSSHSESYSVATATNVNINLQDGVSTLTNGWNYRIRLVTTATATNTGAEYIVYQTAAGTWTSSLVSANGTTSNHPLLGVSGTSVYVYHNSVSTYSVNTFVEGYFTGNTTLTASTFFGIDSALTNLSGFVGIGTTAPAYKLDVQGGSGVVGQFSGRVIGGDALSSNEFATLGQISGGAGQYWQRLAGALSPTNITDDLLIGGSASSSSKFQVFGLAKGTIPAGTASTSGNLVFDATTTQNIDILGNSRLDFRTSVGGDAGLATRMTLAANGNVGIGTTTPATVLDLGGGTNYTNTNGTYQFYSSTGKILQVRDASQSTINLISDINTDGGVIGSIAFSRSGGNTDAHRNVAGIRATQYGTGGLAGGQLEFFTKESGAATELTAPQMVISRLGNVGIGTSAPATRFEVQGDISPLALINRTTANNAALEFRNTGDSVFIGLSPTNNFAIAGTNSLDSSPFLAVTPNGNVGIGTSTPAFKLAVTGTTTGNALVALNQTTAAADIFTASASGTSRFVITNAGNVGIGSTLPANALDIKNAGAIGLHSDNADTSLVNFYDGGTTVHTIRANYSGTGGTGNDLVIGSSLATNALVIEYGGNIGIGTNAPAQLFDVQGGSGVVGQFSGRVIGGDALSSNEFATLGQISGGAGQYWQRLLGALSPSNITDDVLIGGSATASAKIRLGGTTNANSFFNTGGNVGIGTTAPGQLLEVKGSNAVIKIANSTDPASYTLLTDTSATQFTLNKTASSGTSLIDLNPLVTDGTSASSIRAFRNTSTSGRVSLDILKGDNSTTTNSSLAGNGNSYLNANTGNVGIGSTGPTQKLDVAGNIQVNGNQLLLNSSSGSNFIQGNVAAAGTKGGIYDMFQLESRYDDIVIQAGVNDSNPRSITLRSGDNNVGLSVNTAGNVGVGTTTATSLFSVGSTNQFKVNSTGAIAAATGIASSGTINFSGLTASQVVFTDGSKNLVSTGNSAALLNGLSDETGTGLAVFGTSPAITTSLTTGSSSFDLLNTTATTINFGGGATTALNIGPGGATGATINIAGGNGATGCTVDGATGNLACSGTISGVGATGYWNRIAGNLSPATLNDTISATSAASTVATFTSNNPSGTLINNTLIQQTGAGTATNLLNLTQSAGAVTNGLSFTGTFTKLINSTNFNVTNAGAVTVGANQTIDTVSGGTLGIGNTTATTLTLGRSGQTTIFGSTAWTATPTISGLITATSGLTSTGTLTANGTLDANGAFTLGDGGDTGAIDTSDWDVSTTGVMTGISGISTDAPINITTSLAETMRIGSNSSIDGRFEFSFQGGEPAQQDILFYGGDSSNGYNLDSFTIQSDFTKLLGGNVGIGSTAPTAKLDVTGDASLSADLVFGAAGTNNIQVLNGDSLNFQTSPGGDAGLATRITLTNNGNVGIGSTGPAYKLDVSGGSGIVGQFSGRVIGGDAVNSNEFATLGQIAGGAGQFWQRNLGALSPTNITDDLLIGGSATSSATFQVFALATGSTPAGTASMSGNLVLNSTASIQTTKNQTLTIGGNTTGNLIFNPSSTNSIGIGTTTPKNDLDVNGQIAVGTYAGVNTAPTSGIIISGNVGIGTSSPLAGYKLDVSGSLALGANSTIDPRSSGTIALGTGTNTTGLALGKAATTTTFNSTAWTATPTISGLITATSGLTSNGTLTVSNGNTLTAAGVVTLGDGGDNFSVDSNALDISTGGAITGATGITSSGTINFSGLTASQAVFTDGSKNLVSNAITGSGNVVMSTSPTLSTSLIAGSSSFDLLNTTATTINFGGGATTALNIGPSGATGATINIVGGSGATGCTVDGASGNLTCSGVITGSGGAITNLWQRNLGALSPANITDDLLIGGSASSSSKFQVFGLAKGTIPAGTASTSGDLTFDATTTQNINVLGNSRLDFRTSVGGDAGLATRMTLAANGNVGIGTTTTTSTLSVKGSGGILPVTLSSAVGTNPGIEFVDPTAANYGGRIYFDDTANGMRLVGLNNSVEEDGIFVGRQDGNVGIGTTSPGALLDVDGNVRVGANSTIDVRSAGTLGIGNTTATTLTLGRSGQTTIFGSTAWTATPTISGLITASNGLTSNTGSLTSNGVFVANNNFTLGDNGDTGSVNTSDWDISTTGVLTGISGITNDGIYTQTGASQNTFTGNVDATSGLDVSGANLTVADDLYVASGISTFGTAVSNGTVEATKFCTGDGETNCVTDFSSLVAGSTYWNRVAGDLSPANLNDTISATTSAAVALTLTQTGAFNALLVQDQASDTTPFIIDQNGNVGIGTTAAGQELDVNGDILIGAGSTFDTRTGGTLAIGTATQTGLTIGRTTTATTLLNGSTVQIDSGDWDISTTGVLTGISGITNDGIYTQTGASQNTFTGNVDATSGLDVSGASLTVGGANFSVTTAGLLTAASNIDINGTSNDIAGTLNLSGNSLTSSGDLTIAPTGGDVAFTGNANPTTDSTYDLGTNLVRWRNGYFDTLFGDGSNLIGVTAGAVTFTNITSGTNTTAAMTLGSGSSLTAATGVTVTGNSGSTFDINGDLAVADTNIAFDGASTIFTTTGAFTLNTGGAILLGDGADTLQINSSDWDISTTGVLTGISGITNDGIYTQTGASQNTFTGNVDATSGLDVSGASLTVGGANFSVTTAGLLTAASNIDINGTANDIAGTLNLSGNILAASGDLQINPVGNNVLFSDTTTLQIGGVAAVAYNSFSNSGGTPTNPNVTADNDLFVQGDLDIGGTLYLNGTQVTAAGITNYWQRLLGAVSPANITDDLLIGGSASSSSKFQVFGLAKGTTPAGTASTSGNLVFDATTTQNIDVLGGSRLDFRTSPGGDAGLATRMTLAANGNVGIGTTTTTAGTLSLAHSGSGTFLALDPGGSNNYADIMGSAGNGIRLYGGTAYNTGPAFQIWPTGSTFQGMYFDAGNAANANINFRSTPGGTTTLAIAQGTGTITATGTLAANGTLDGNGVFTLGDNGDTGAIDTNDWDISTTGVLTGVSGITTDGGYTQSGATANTLTGVTTIQSTSGSGIASVYGMNDGYSGGTMFVVKNDSTNSNNNYIHLEADTNGTPVSFANFRYGGTGNLVLDNTSGGGISFTGGNVGIGTTVPLGALRVSSAFTLAQGQAALQVINTSTGDLFTASSSGNTRFLIKNAGNVAIGTLVNNTGQLLSVAGFAEAQRFSDITNNSYFLDPAATDTSLTAGGFVGIGTTAPNTYLHVNGTTTLAQGQALALVNQTGAGDLFTASTSGTTRFVIKNDGNVGIGSATKPLGLLNISGATTLAQGQSALQVNNTSTGDLFTASTSGTTRFLITNAGNVGIGTIAPALKLEVAGLNAGGEFVATGFTNTSDALRSAVSIGFATTATSGFYGATIGARRTSGLQDDELIFSTSSNATLAQRMVINKDGNVGVGTLAAQLRFQVGATETATASAMIENFSGSSTADGLIIKLGGNTIQNGNHWLEFQNGTGIIKGSIRGDGTSGTQFQTSGIADFAEYMLRDTNEDIPWGALLCQGSNGNVTRCNDSNTSLIGVASENPSFVGGVEGPDRITVGLVGVVNTQVSTENGPINPGDPITISSNTGVGKKATKASQIVGRAVGSYSGSGVGKIYVTVANSYYNPDIYLAQSGNYNISGNDEGSFEAWSGGYKFENKGGFSDAAIARLTAGITKTKELVVSGGASFLGTIQAGTINASSIAVNNVSIAGQSLSDYIIAVVSNAGFTSNGNGGALTSPIASIDQVRTNLISPLATGEILIDGNTKITGDLKVEKTLTAKNITAQDATISGTLHADKIIANDIEGLNARIASIAANTVTASSAAITNIYNTYNTASGSGSASESGQTNPGSSLIASSISTNFADIASLSAGLAYLPSLTSDFATFTQGLMSFGATSLADTSVTGQLSVGSSLILADNTINTLGSTLEINPLRQGNISFMGGLVAIDIDGNLLVGGKAIFAKDVAVNGTLQAGIISPVPDSDLIIQLPGSSYDSQALAVNRPGITVKNGSGSAVLKITDLGDVIASGAGSFAKLAADSLKVARGAQADTSLTETVASSSAGTGIIKTGQFERTIVSPFVTADSLIYITPTSDTGGKAPYVARQTAEDPQTGTKGSFTIRIPQTVLTDVRVNWWIIN